MYNTSGIINNGNWLAIHQQNINDQLLNKKYSTLIIY